MYYSFEQSCRNTLQKWETFVRWKALFKSIIFVIGIRRELGMYFFPYLAPLCTMNYVLCVNIRNGKKTYIFSSSFCACYRNTRCSTILTNIEIVQNWKHFFLIILISSLRKKGAPSLGSSLILKKKSTMLVF